MHENSTEPRAVDLIHAPSCAGRPSGAPPSGTAYSRYVQPLAARQNAGSIRFIDA